MAKKPTLNEEKLRKLIRSMIQEELSKLHGYGEPFPSWEAPEPSRLHEPIPSDEEMPPEDGWAHFGPPKPDPMVDTKSKQSRPRALPGWVDPFQSPMGGAPIPYIHKKKKK